MIMNTMATTKMMVMVMRRRRTTTIVIPMTMVNDPMCCSGGNMRRACRSQSLLQLLNRTRTACGGRLLRASLLQPLTDAPTICARHDAVSELMESSDMAFGGRPPGSSRASRATSTRCASASAPSRPPPPPPRRQGEQEEHQGGARGASRRGRRPLGASRPSSRRSCSVRRLLEALPALAEALGPAKGVLLATARGVASAPVFAALVERTHAVIDEEAQTTANAFMNHIQCCFAVKVVLLFPPPSSAP